LAIDVLPESERLVGFQIDQGFHKITLNVAEAKRRVALADAVVRYQSISDLSAKQFTLIEFSIIQIRESSNKA